jgi:hypothetical protein
MKITVLETIERDIIERDVLLSIRSLSIVSSTSLSIISLSIVSSTSLSIISLSIVSSISLSIIFFYYPFCRQKFKNNRYFGGLGILIKKDIRKGIQFLEDGNSEYQWLKLDKSFFQLKKDIYLCTLYLVPQSSPYLTKMEINVLERIIEEVFNIYSCFISNVCF